MGSAHKFQNCINNECNRKVLVDCDLLIYNNISIVAVYNYHPDLGIYNSSLNVKTIDVDTTRNIIDCLNSKSSCGKDSTLTQLLKSQKDNICEAVTLIVNQSIITGIFQNK